MKVLGVDPGLSGAWALLNADGSLIACDELPIVRHGKIGWVDGPKFAELLTAHLRAAPGSVTWVRGDLSTFEKPMPCVAFVERSQAMPGQGVSSSFQIGVTFGSILPTLQQLGAAIRLISAAEWKRKMGLTRDKVASLDRAHLLFPGVRLDRKRDHNMAEALLIAYYGAMTCCITAKSPEFTVPKGVLINDDNSR